MEIRRDFHLDKLIRKYLKSKLCKLILYSAIFLYVGSNYRIFTARVLTNRDNSDRIFVTIKESAMWSSIFNL